MPIVQVNMLEGRTDDQKEALIAEITEAMVRSISAPRESVRVMINEMPKQHFGIGGSSVQKMGR
ncbi:2-hydroxymuconate tautomerase [Neptunomonas japonica]|uniref:2-hydroxymuconate tautomerase n=1 Tax=Neptunomonas japonica TaxID=417574 RepID=UPI00040C56F2|nr:2-hydroxymuconate tautomerase [Neptunomonas japonica]